MPPPPQLDAFAHRRYALVIDAGSSGSRLQIYSWRDPKSEKAELLAMLDVGSRKGKAKAAAEGGLLRRLPRVEKGVAGGSGDWQKKVEPGISSLANAPISVSATSAYLAPLLEHARKAIPPSHHASTPVYILATAGMRLLPEADSAALINATCDVLRKQTPFAVQPAGPLGPCGDSVRIISGEEEGLWGWVAVNYLMDGFGDPAALVPSTPAAWEDAADRKAALDDVTPFGFLDMGGASTQIAFAPSAAEASAHQDSLSAVKLRLLSGEDLNYDVFVASWLGYGTNKARERYVGLLVERWEASGRPPVGDGSRDEPAIPDPCLPTSLALVETPKLPLSALTTASSSAALQHASSPHTLAGTGSFDACLRSLQPLLNKDLPCPIGSDPTTCLFGGLSTPHIDFARQRFIGVSEYWYSSEHVFGLGGAWDFEEFERKASAFCGEDWSTIEHRFERSAGGPHTGDGEVLDSNGQVVATGKWGPEVELSRLKMQCFKAAWLVNVLHEGIGLPRTIDPESSPAAHAPSHSNGQSLPSSPSDTELEAVKKASEKGLLPPTVSVGGATSARKKTKGKPHFQSVDTVGDTAISWTLGKMVIEASRGVEPRLASSAREPWFALPRHLNGTRLAQLRPDGQAIYVIFGLLAMLFILGRIIRGCGKPNLRGSPGRRGKKVADFDAEEEAFLGSGTTTPSLRPVKRSGSLWSLVSTLRRILPFQPRGSQSSAHQLRSRGTLKHVNSSPAIMSDFAASAGSVLYRPSASAFASQSNSPPPSPRRPVRPGSVEMQFTRRLSDEEYSSGGGADAPLTNGAQLANGAHVVGIALPGGPPPRMQRRPSPQTGPGGQSVDFHLLPLREILGRTLPASTNGGGSSGGWNDVPADLLASGLPSHAGAPPPTQHRSGVLTPPATSLNSLKSSRNSSRVDLTGLTGRNFSRNNMTMSSDDS